MLRVASSIFVIALFFGSSGADAITDDPPSSDIAGESSKSKQLPVPYILPPREPVRVIRLTPVSGIQIRERQGVAQEPIIYSRSILSFLLALIFNQLTSTTTSTTTVAPPPPSTTTVLPCDVSWGTWTSCNLVGARYRTRMCPTGLQTDQGICLIDCLVWSTWSSCVTPSLVDEKRARNRQCRTGYETEQKACYSSTTTGYTSDGWYRASNGYEYKYISTPTTFNLAVTTCEGMDADSMLATTGARSSDIGSGLDRQGMGIANNAIYYVGASDAIAEDSWVFHDDVVLATASISNWASGEPNSGSTENCMVWWQSSSGLGDASCGGSYPALCERKAS